MSDTSVELKMAVEIVIGGYGSAANISVGQIILDTRGHGQYLVEIFSPNVPECRSWAVTPRYIWDLHQSTNAESLDFTDLKKIIGQTIKDLNIQKAA